MTENIIDTFIRIENAAHTGAFGDNQLAIPTDAKKVNQISYQVLSNAAHMYESGLTRVQIRENLGISLDSVDKAIRTFGISTRKGPAIPGNKISDDVLAKAAGLYKGGMTRKQVKKELNIGFSTIDKALHLFGIVGRRGLVNVHNKHPMSLVDCAIKLYVESEMTAPDVAKTLGISASCVSRWLVRAGVKRSMSEAFSLAITKGRKKPTSINIHWQSKKTGAWEFADSKWEAVRMSQLDNDDRVVFWTRKVDRVPYFDVKGKSRTYIPDFLITYKNGAKVIEEVKPLNQINDEINLIKFRAAKSMFSELGVEFKVITEIDIGIENISTFKLEGFAQAPELVKAERRRQMRNLACRNRIAIKNAGKVRENGSPNYVTSIITRNEAVDLYQKGLSLLEVGAAVGVSASSVGIWLKKRGIDRRKAAARGKDFIKNTEVAHG